MKTIQHHLAGAARIGVSVVAILGFGMPCASAGGLNSVKLPLVRQEFGQNLEIHAKSGKKKLAASESYEYKLQGFCEGTGDLANLIPKRTPIATLLNQLSPGNSKFISGTYSNPGGKLPIVAIDKTFKGKLTFPRVGIVTIKATVKAGTEKNGTVYLDVTNVNVKSPTKVDGTIKFQSGSKFTIIAAPLIQFKTKVRNAEEDGGVIDVLVIRSGDTRQAVTAQFATADDTASSSDYTPSNGTISFAKNEKEKLISVPITNNAIKDGYRKFTITLSNPSKGAYIGSNNVATIGILDDE